jgi:AcrR family transcriptional regulator
VPAGTLAGMTSRPRAAAAPAAETAGRGRPRDPAADHAILAAVFRQLVDVGYGGLSMEAVAAEAGVAKTTIYRRYPSKRDLVLAALQAEVPFDPPVADLPSREAIGLFVHTAIAMLIGSGAFRVLGSLLLEDRREPGLLDAFRARLLGPRRMLVEAMLRRGIERGEIRPDIDPLIVTEMIAGAVFGHHVILGMTGDDAWVAALVDHIWAAIAAPAAGVSPAGADLRRPTRASASAPGSPRRRSAGSRARSPG